jgi:putative ABC transport system permease protein
MFMARIIFTTALYLNLAARNVVRNGSRSALALGAIFFGVSLTVLVAAFNHGFIALEVNDVVKAKTGGIHVHLRGYADQKTNQPLKLNMPADGALERTMLAVPDVAAVAPRISFGGLVSNGREATMFVGRGVDPVKEYQALPWARREVQGKPIRADAPHAGVVGRELLQGLGSGMDGTLILQAATQAGRPNALDLDIGGTLAETSNALDAKRLIHVPLAFAQALLDLRGRATEYVVRPRDGADLDQVAGALRAALGPGYEVDTWRAMRPDIVQQINFQRLILTIISTVFLVIVIFGVINTMLMSVFERTREIGTMMALGMRRASIGALLLLEAAVLAVLGGGGGAAVARVLVALSERAGGFLVAARGTLVARHHLVPIIPPGIVSAAVTGAVIGALLAALYPAWKATRLRPVEALTAV